MKYIEIIKISVLLSHGIFTLFCFGHLMNNKAYDETTRVQIAAMIPSTLGVASYFYWSTELQRDKK